MNIWLYRGLTFLGAVTLLVAIDLFFYWLLFKRKETAGKRGTPTREERYNKWLEWKEREEIK